MNHQEHNPSRYALAGFGLAGLLIIAGLVIATVWAINHPFFKLPGASQHVHTRYGLRAGMLQMESNYTTPDSFRQVRRQFRQRLKVNDHLYEYNGAMCSMMRDTVQRLVVDLHTTVVVCGAGHGQRVLVVRGLELVRP